MHTAKIEQFTRVMDELINSKFILIDVKINRLLAFLSENDEFFQTISTAIADFDYKMEFTRATKDGEFKLANNLNKIIALVFCMLVEIENKKFDIYTFLSKFFKQDNMNDSYQAFSYYALVNFKSSIMLIMRGLSNGEALVNLTDTAAEQTLDEQDAENSEEAEAAPAPEAKPVSKASLLKEACLEIGDASVEHRGCYNSGIIVNAMLKAIKTNDEELFDALKVALFNSTKNKKFVKLAKATLLEVQNKD